MKKILLRSLFAVIAMLAVLIFYYFPTHSSVDETVEVPFTFERDIILLEAMLNGRGPFNMILDTGTDPSVVDSKIASDITWFQIPLGGQGSSAASDRIEVTLPTPIDIKVGGVPAARKMFLGIDLSSFSERLGKPVHGILGHNFISDHVLEIDYPARTIRFHEASTTTANEMDEVDVRRIVLPMAFLEGENFPLIEDFHVSGKPLKVTLDTGSNSNLTLYSPAVPYLGLEETYKEAVAVTSESYGGSVEKSIARLTGIAIGHWELEDQDVSLITSGPQADTPLQVRGGNLGNGILKKFVVTLNYDARWVSLEQR